MDARLDKWAAPCPDSSLYLSSRCRSTPGFLMIISPQPAVFLAKLTVKQKTMKKLFFLLLVLPGCLNAYTQSKPRDSLYFVRMLDGTTLYSRKVQLINSLTRGKYLLLDSNRHIPLSLAREFKGWDGTFAIGNVGAGFDAFRLQNEGARISLYSQCYYSTETYYTSTTPDGPSFPTTISTAEKAWYFRKGEDGNIQRLTYRHLQDALADNPACTRELKIAGTNMYIGIGLLAGGTALIVGGIIQTVKRNNDAYNAFKTASANWYNASIRNPGLPPPSAAAHYGVSPLTYIGGATLLTAFIPILNVNKHARKALDIYNGID
jgi:hypothetical protein